MEHPEAQPGEDPVVKPLNLENQLAESPVENVKKVTKSGKSSKEAESKVSTPATSTRKKSDTRNGSELSSGFVRSTTSSSLRASNSVMVTRRNSTGGVPEKLSATSARQQNKTSTIAGKKSSTPATESIRRSLPELRRSSLPSVATKSTSRANLSETRKSIPVTPVVRSLSTSTASDTSIQKTVRKSAVKPALSASLKKITSSSLDSTASSTSRKTISKISSPTTRSPTVSSGSRAGSLSSSLDRSSNLSGRKKAVTPQSRDSRLIVLPQVEIRAGDDVRLDLRGHRVRSLNASGLNLSPNLEFVYLRDNLLSTLEGVEILTRVKVLDLSFNDFKGPGFEHLENCKALQQLYLAGNQITSLVSLPQLPNLEFLSVAQNKLKSLSVASQPRLRCKQKQNINSKGFSLSSLLEHLGVDASSASCLLGLP